MSAIDPRLLQICESYTRAVLEKNVEAFLNLYHPTARVFDTWGVWSYEGGQARRKVIEQWFGSLGEERVAVTFDRVQTTVTGDLASLTARVVYAAISPTGAELRSMQNRLTWMLKPEGDSWKIIHEHTSVPIAEDWTEWQEIMALACQTHHVIALDFPGIGESRGPGPGGEKAAIAVVVHQAIRALGITRHTLVGHDAGAMVTYAYLRKFAADLKAAVLVSSVIPGVNPWDRVAADAHVWHFAFHHIPQLPETLVQGRQRAYFDYFFDLLTFTPTAGNDLKGLLAREA